MITLDENGKLIFSIDGSRMEFEEAVGHYLAMNDEEFETCYQAINLMSAAWNEAYSMRFAPKGIGH